MKTLTHLEHGKFALLDKPKPQIINPRDAIARMTLSSVCTSDLHIEHGSVPGWCRVLPSAMRWSVLWNL